jgi:hypothetical protein
LLLEAESLISQIEPEGSKITQVQNFQSELERILDQVLKERQAAIATFIDLELIRQAAKGDDWAFSGDKMMILDQAKRAVYEVTLEKKSSVVAGGEDFQAAKQIAAFLPEIFVLTEKGILRVNRLSQKESWVVTFEEQLGEVIDFQTFAGNLYLLTKESIWQYPVAAAGYGSQRQWLKGETPDFSQAASMAIDGSIWVLMKDGQIKKFTRGSPDAFGIAALDQPLAQPSHLYTDDDLENLYLVDESNSRVVVISKSGEYQASYLLGEIERINGLIASEEEGKIWLLVGSKIYEMAIK